MTSRQIDDLITMYNNGEFEKLLTKIRPLLESFPTEVVLLNLQGASNSALKRYEASISSYRLALEIDPNFSEAYNNLGVALKEIGEPNKALENYKKAIEIDPRSTNAYNNIGLIFREWGDIDAAIESFKKALDIQPNFPVALNNLAASLFENGDLNGAIENYERAIQIKPDYAEAYVNLGISMQQTGDLTAAVNSFEQALKIRPSYPEAYSNMGDALRDQGQLETALGMYKQALSMNPEFAEVYYSIGNILHDMNDPITAIEYYSKALSIKPNYQLARAKRLFRHALICDWQAIDRDREYISDLGISTQHIEPFTILSLEDAPEYHRLRSELYVKNSFKQKAIKFPIRFKKKPVRLRIGYFSADFHEHPVSYLITQTLREHDRKNFEIYAYSYGPDRNDKLRQEIVNAVDVFRDVKIKSDREIALLARKDEINISIDLAGYTANVRSGIFAYRASPIQISYLGYPGTMGASFIDYIIADQNLIPLENQTYYSERPIYLPNHFQAQNNSLLIANGTTSRAKLGLPEVGFVFCAINNTYKITPAEFDIWMRLLHTIKGSVLWLLEKNKWAKANLLKEANLRGIKSDRLVFAQKVEHDQYLAQFRHADLFLDTFVYNAGATASNALWAGLPVLTKVGKGYSARMASSLLLSIGLPELITSTETEYENLALALASNPKLLAFIKLKLKSNREKTPLFNAELFTRQLEIGYKKAFDLHLAGKPPEPIYIKNALVN